MLKDTKFYHSTLFISIVSLILALCIATAFVFAWLSLNRKTESDGIDITINDVGSIYLASKGVAVNSTNSNSDLSVFFTKVFTFENNSKSFKINGTDKTITGNVTGSGETEWLIDSDNNLLNYGTTSKGIEPGSSGQMKFYIIPKEDGDINVHISLTITGYDKDKEASTDELANQMFRGRLNFYLEHNDETGIYSKWISDNSFDVEINGAKEGIAYEYIVYWNWPVIVSQMIFEDGNSFLHGYKSILDVDSRADYINHIKAHPEYYFYFNENIYESEDEKQTAKTNYNQTILALKNAENLESLTETQVSTLSSSYNSGDQHVGETLWYFTLMIQAQVLE